MLKVLFVCTANICRSPYMELAARAMVRPGTAVEFSSAGTLGLRDRPMDATMATAFDHSPEVTARHIAAFRSRRLTPDLIAAADVVLTAEEEHRQFVLLEQPMLFRKVFTLGQFSQTIARLGTLPEAGALIETVGTTSGIAQIRADVADPYRRGRRAAAAAAHQIDEMLAVLVPALEGSVPAPTDPHEEEQA